MNLNTNWIWASDWTYQDEENPRLVYFRKEFTLSQSWGNGKVSISADSRYKLYVNNIFVEAGPSKGDKETWYYDEVDITSHLQEGKNVLGVEVLRYPEDKEKRNYSIHRGEFPGLYVSGSIKSDEHEIDLSGISGWKYHKADHITLVKENARPAPLYILEKAEYNIELHGWKLPSYEDAQWQNAKNYSIFHVDTASSPGNLTLRNIPYQRYAHRSFQKVICLRDTSRNIEENKIKQQWNGLLSGEEISIPAKTIETVEISAGELMTGFLLLEMAGGKDTMITLHCAECYSYANQDNQALINIPKKGDREDYIDGRLHGYEDYYKVAGSGSDTIPETYEPFWFRTFRFIGITIETAEEPLVLKGLTYRETGYPLEVKSQVITSDDTLAPIWDISERTLRRCMHETYMDCPFYEQLQYAMDSRNEILFTYTAAADDRLARKTMDDFRRSQRSDGLINSCAPNSRSNVIPSFSIYYILMVYDHMMYFGDKSLVALHFPAIDGVLNCFMSHLSKQGIVEGIGGLYMRKPYWSFIDWVKEWNVGTPLAIEKGPITMDSLLYILGLEHAAELADFMMRDCIATQYRNRADEVRKSIKKYCMGSNGLIQDGPGVDEYSVHGQVFGVLANVLSEEEGKEALLKTIGNSDYGQCSVAMNYYLFRAIEKVNLYEKTENLWDVWRDMVKKNLTTCVENSTDERSDCHGWGSLILYELPAVVLGVRPTKPGFEEVMIAPNPGYLTYAKGQVVCPKGIIEVEWKKDEQGKIRVVHHVPEGVLIKQIS